MSNLADSSILAAVDEAFNQKAKAGSSSDCKYYLNVILTRTFGTGVGLM